VTTMAAAKVTLVKNHKRHFHMHATSMVWMDIKWQIV
jgi:hypothetical protein